MTKIIKATFVRKHYQDSGKDQSPDYYVYEFTDIVGGDNKKIGSKWFKETKLLQAIKFKKGCQYQIILSDYPYSDDVVNLPYPLEISCGKEKVYLKNNNSIIKVDKKGNEINLSSDTLPQLLAKAKREWAKKAAKE
jgi:hypothetical protein